MSEESMKTLKVLDQIRLLVDNAKTVPFTSKLMIEKNELASLLGSLDASLPEDIKHAQEVLTEQEKILGDSREEAERTLREAREEATKTLDEARTSAEKMVHDAEESSAAQLNDAQTRSSQMLQDASGRANAAVAEATQKSQAIVADAELRARQMTDESTIMQNARDQADQLLNATRQDCQAYSQEVRQNMMKLIEAADAGLEAQLNSLRDYRQQMNNA